MKVNLHVHSTASDGLHKPSDVISLLAKEGVEACALTDHDTLKGLEEAKNQADKENIQFINGIEISTKIYNLDLPFLDSKHHTLHLLGLGFNYEQLVTAFEERQKEKTKRLTKLIKTLEQKGYNLKLKNITTKKSIIAEALVRNGYASDVQEAFNHIINNYYNKADDDISVSDVVSMIHNTHGKVIWAHPFDILYDIEKVTLTEREINHICNALKKVGIDGIEVYYASYSKNQITFLHKMQQKYNFITSAGTDYHGRLTKELKYIAIDTNLIKGVMT